nr:lysine-specific demethylase jmj25 [Quercus suber]
MHVFRSVLKRFRLQSDLMALMKEEKKEEAVVNVKRRRGRQPKLEAKRDSAEEEEAVIAKRRRGRKPKEVKENGKPNSAEEKENHPVLANQQKEGNEDNNQVVLEVKKEEVVNVQRRRGRKPKEVKENGKPDSAEEKENHPVLANQQKEGNNQVILEEKKEEVVNVKWCHGRKPTVVEEGKEEVLKNHEQHKEQNGGFLNDEGEEEKKEEVLNGSVEEEEEIEGVKSRLRNGGIKKVSYAVDNDDSPVKNKRGRKKKEQTNANKIEKTAEENDGLEKPKGKRGVRNDLAAEEEKGNEEFAERSAGYSLREKRTKNQNLETVEKINKHDPKWIEEVSLMCHQCQRNDKGRVIQCKNCKRKRYCKPCLDNWYPNIEEDYIAEACPVCRGNCNCKACLRLDVPVKNLKNLDLDISEDEKFEHYKYMLQILLPFLQRISEEQMAEKELEAQRRVITSRVKD